MSSQEDHNKKIIEQVSANPTLIKNKWWRMCNLYWIVDRDGKRSVFTPNKAQTHFATNYLLIPKPFHRHIILKSRQLGFTTFIDIWILDDILFNTNLEGLIIAHKMEDAKEIFDRKVDFAIRNMSEELKGALFKVNRNSAKKIQVVVDYGPEKGSMSSIAVSTSGRSGTFHRLHISEFAPLCVQFPKRAEEVITGTFPAVPLDGFIFIESTAETMGDKFYEMFNASWLTRDKITPQLSRVMFLPHFYSWRWDESELGKVTEVIPIDQMMECEIPWGEYQREHGLTDIEISYYYIKWLQLGGKNSTDAIKKLHQQFPTTTEEAFLSTGQTYFSTSKVMSLMNNSKHGRRGELVQVEGGGYKFQETDSGNLELFEEPEPGVQYVIGGDTSEGLARGDAQALYVISHKTQKCAAVYNSQVAPDDLIHDAYHLGKYYNWAILAVESNKDGLWVNNGLEKMGYQNLYYRKVFDDITKNMTKFFGWKTTSATRPFALAALKSVFLRLDDGFPKILLGEMISFVRNIKGKAEAMDGKHDDTIMAAAIAYAVEQEMGTYFEEQKAEGFSMAKIMFSE